MDPLILDLRNNLSIVISQYISESQDNNICKRKGTIKKVHRERWLPIVTTSLTIKLNDYYKVFF